MGLVKCGACIVALCVCVCVCVLECMSVCARCMVCGIRCFEPTLQERRQQGCWNHKFYEFKLILSV